MNRNVAELRWTKAAGGTLLNKKQVSDVVYTPQLSGLPY
jgi:hypothetical protein